MDFSIALRAADQTPLSAMARRATTGLPPSMSHFIPARLIRWVNRILHAASVMPLPIVDRGLELRHYGGQIAPPLRGVS